MNGESKSPGTGVEAPKRSKGLLLAFAALVLIGGFSLAFPDKRAAILEGSGGFLREVVFILPAVCVLMGLFGAFVSKDLVMRILGKSSGWKGALLSIGLGSLPTGPLYAAFPLAAALREKGARSANIFLFLTAWACIKLPQELLELRFLGPRFMLIRLALTVALAVPAAFLVERYVDSVASRSEPESPATSNGKEMRP